MPDHSNDPRSDAQPIPAPTVHDDRRVELAARRRRLGRAQRIDAARGIFALILLVTVGACLCALAVKLVLP